MPAVARNRFKTVVLLLAGMLAAGSGWPGAARTSAPDPVVVSRTQESGEPSPVSEPVVQYNQDKFRQVISRNESRGTRNPVRAMVQLGHVAPITSVAWSPDGTYVVTSGGDNTALVWETATGKLTTRLIGHLKWILAAVWSPDGTRIATASGDKSVRVWDAVTGKELVRLDGHTNYVNSCAWSPDGSRIVSAGYDGSAIVWEAATGREMNRITIPSSPVSTARWSPDGNRIVAVTWQNEALVWTPGDHAPIRLTGHAGRLWSAEWSPDGRSILTTSDDGTVRVWEAATAHEIRRFSFEPGKTTADWSPDGRKIVAGGKSSPVRIFETETGKVIAETVICSARAIRCSPDGTRIALLVTENLDALILDATGRQTARLDCTPRTDALPAWSPAGDRVAVASDPQKTGLFDANGKNPRWLEGRSGRVTRVAWSPTAPKFLVVTDDSPVAVWSPETGKGPLQLTGHAGLVFDAQWSPDGTRIATVGMDRTARVWDAASGQELWKFEGHAKTAVFARWSPDGTRLLTVGQEATVFLHRPETGAPTVKLTAGKKPFSNAEWSPDGKSVLTGGRDGTVRWWNPDSGKETRRLVVSADTFVRVSWSPVGNRFLTEGGDGTVRIWNAGTATETAHFGDLNQPVTFSAWSPDGKSVVTGSQFPFDRDKTAHIWSADSGHEVMRLVGHALFIESAEWSPDSAHLLTVGNDGVAAWWDVATGLARTLFVGHFGVVTGASRSGDGKFVLTGGHDGTARLWSAATGRETCQLVSFENGEEWAVIDRQGRFDVSDPGDITGLHWVIEENGRATPYGIELFFRQYYEPGLLRRIFAGENFPPIPSIARLNRAQPVVSIGETDVSPVVENGQPTGFADVTVTVAPPAGLNNAPSGRAFDLKLFRDGQLVGFSPGEQPYSAAAGFQKTFRVQLPRRDDHKAVEFSAYCFNGDLVRSTKAVRKVAQPELETRKGTAYVVTFGVNRSRNPKIAPLRFAVADALAFQRTLGDRLEKSGAFSKVVRISLTSEIGEKPTATGKNLKTVLMRLSGQLAMATDIPDAARLSRATPEDVVILCFAGHGYRGRDGEFYIVPFDTGSTGGLAEILKNSISSADLSRWLRDVDAGDLTMILDTCQSAGAVGEEFKPGPMGSRGLGQLSFDKGMRILAATQADNVAMESGVLKQGFLTFALIAEGLNEGKADFAPPDGTITLGEWLEYGVKRVPELPAAIADGRVKARILTQEGRKLPKQQVPVVFDFAKRRRVVVLQNAEKK